LALDLSEKGENARDTIISDFKLITKKGASPILNHHQQ
jgi:hypothetical protein